MILRLELITLLICSAVSQKFNLRKIETLTSTVSGSGMDKASFSWVEFGYTNGGSYEIQICNNGSCCRTGILNTVDDNWELGQTDWFVAEQIHQCYRFDLEPTKTTQLTLYHTGSNEGKLDYIKLHSWHSGAVTNCPIRAMLVQNTSITVDCTYYELEEDDLEESAWCNGSKYFCPMKLNQYLFPGAHNAGTGQSDGILQCVSKNQDLNITGQLEFGIRFFDIDIIYSTQLPGCDGLETGHGNMPEFGIYQCYGKVEKLLLSVRGWLNDHPSEVIVMRFGNIEYNNATIPALVEVITNIFSNEDHQVRLNSDYKETGKWPTLRKAVEQNKRVFVFVQDPSIQQNKDMVEEIKLRRGEIKAKMPGAALFATSYQAKSIGSDCSYVLENVVKACSRKDADFVKLSLFTAYFKSGVDCLWQLARYCNKLVDQAIQICNKVFPECPESEDLKFAPNILLLDYPNYQTNEELNAVELSKKENYRRAKLIINSKDFT